VFEIQKDLDRTLPTLQYFRDRGGKGQAQLERVLTGVALYYKKLGYVQGMNFLAATLILSFSGSSCPDQEKVREEEAFWMLISMLVNFKYD
jgi:TBC1 domain family member 10